MRGTTSRVVRKVGVPALALAALFVTPTAVLAAPGGDAVVVSSQFTVADGATPSGSAVVMCPSGKRAVGGGVTPTSPLSADNYRVQMSGPVDETTLVQNTESGDIPRGWAVTVSHFGSSPTQPEPFRVFALCSKNSDATLAMEHVSPSAGLNERAPACPGTTRAVGGGVGTYTPITAGTHPYFIHFSSPVDVGGILAGTANGDVAKAWYTAIFQQGTPYILRFYTICSAKSDAIVRTSSFEVAARSIGGTAALCPTGRRALSGGLALDSAIDPQDRLQYTFPGSAGAVGRAGFPVTRWFAQATNRSDNLREYKAMAICARSTPPETVKRSGPASTITKRSATFRFTSPQRGTTFVCRLDDKPWRACESPKTVKRLKLGRHVFRVAAVDLTGVKDPTPAVFRFKVVAG